MAGRPTDHELRRRVLKLKNAHDQKGVVERPLRSDDVLIDILNIYEHENWPAEKVYCSQCRGHHHKRGFTALLATGERVFLGSKCGAEAFGETWIVAKKRMEKLADRQWELDRLDRFDMIVGPLRRALYRWERPMQSAMARRLTFQRTGDLAWRVNEAARAEAGALTVYRDVDTKIATEAGMKVTAQRVKVVVDQITGINFFEYFDAANAVTRAQLALEGMAQSLVDTDSILDHKTMTRRRKGFEATFADLTIASRIYHGAEEFFTLNNFRRIVEWAMHYRITESRYSFDEKAGSINYEDGRIAIMLPREPMPELDDTPLELIAEYKRAD